MELDFSADQDALRDSVRAVLANESPIRVARGVAEQGDSPAALWTTMVALGWPALTIAEADGGVGLGMVEAGILAEELGRVIAPGPLLPTVTQYVPAVRETATPEQRAAFLGAVASGTVTGTLAVAERRGSYDPAAVTTIIRLEGDQATVDGEKRYVMEGDAVDEVVVVGREPGTHGDDGVRAVVVPVAAARVSPVKAFDGTRRIAHLDFDGVTVDATRVLGAASAPALRRAIEEATLGLALEMVGTAQTIFDVALDYARQREQFGVPIGSFQAIKHKFVDMMIALERARATGYFAALTISEDDPRRASATSVAKAAAGDCQRLLGKEGIQILGGIGYTWEHDMHLLVKRMKSGEALFGTTAVHHARIADLLGV